MPVVAIAVGALAPLCPALLYKAVSTHDKVIPDIRISLVINVAVAYFTHTPVNIRLRRSAMDDDLCNFSHLYMKYQNG